MQVNRIEITHYIHITYSIDFTEKNLERFMIVRVILPNSSNLLQSYPLISSIMCGFFVMICSYVFETVEGVIAIFCIYINCFMYVYLRVWFCFRLDGIG